MRNLVLTGTRKDDKVCDGVCLEQSLPIDRREFATRCHRQYISSTVLQSLERTFNLDTCADHVNRERQREPLRLDVVDLHRSNPSGPAKSISLLKVRLFPTISISMWTKSMMLKWPVGEEEMSAWTRRFQWMLPGTIHSRLQGATHVHNSINQAAPEPCS